LRKAFNFFCSEPLSYGLRLSLTAPGPQAGAALGQISWGCLNGDAWLGGGAGREWEVLFPEPGDYFPGSNEVTRL
jgi:hypothetical protein